MSATHEPDDDAEASRELRELYRALQPPPLADDADDADPETARAVQWMRDAWQGLEIPAARVPMAPRRVRRVARPLRFALLAAAAALLALGGAALWRALGRAPSAPSSAPRLADRPAPRDTSGVEVLAALPDRLELRSGPVRLVLLAPADDAPTNGATTNGTPTSQTHDLPTGG